MKIEEAKIGDWVIATKKSLNQYVDYKTFVKNCPLGVGEIVEIYEDIIIVKDKDIRYRFAPEDLVRINYEADEKATAI